MPGSGLLHTETLLVCVALLPGRKCRAYPEDALPVQKEICLCSLLPAIVFGFGFGLGFGFGFGFGFGLCWARAIAVAIPNPPALWQ